MDARFNIDKIYFKFFILTVAGARFELATFGI